MAGSKLMGLPVEVVIYENVVHRHIGRRDSQNNTNLLSLFVCYNYIVRQLMAECLTGRTVKYLELLL